MDWKTFFTAGSYVVLTGAAFAITYATLKLKIIDRIQAERLALEQEKTAKERKDRELAEAKNARLTNDLVTILERVKDTSEKMLNVEQKVDATARKLDKNNKTIEKQTRAFKKLKTKADSLT